MSGSDCGCCYYHCCSAVYGRVHESASRSPLYTVFAVSGWRLRHAVCIAFFVVPEGTSIDCRFERRHPRCLGLACAVRRYRPCGSVRQAYLAIVCRGAPSPHSRREASGWADAFQLFFPRTARQKASGAAGH